MDTKTGPIPPENSIADKNVIGDTCLLGFRPFNRVDEILLALDHPCTYVTTAISGGNKMHKFHNFVVKNTSGAPLAMLKREFNPTGSVRIAMCGPNTDLFKSQILKYYTPDLKNDELLYKFCLEHSVDFVDQPDLSSRFTDPTLCDGINFYIYICKLLCLYLSQQYIPIHRYTYRSHYYITVTC